MRKFKLYTAVPVGDYRAVKTVILNVMKMPSILGYINMIELSRHIDQQVELMVNSESKVKKYKPYKKYVSVKDFDYIISELKRKAKILDGITTLPIYDFKNNHLMNLIKGHE